jgi:hypothetical protein
MTVAVSIDDAKALYQELLTVNAALALIAAGGRLVSVTIAQNPPPPLGLGNIVNMPLPAVNVPAALTTALTNRQATLRTQLAALDVTGIP